ncbi:MAG: DNA-binding domain-containing protein [Pseudomonadota bacterium]
MNLAQTQQAFSAWLRTGAPEDTSGFGHGAQPGLGIYQNNYRSQLASCLEDSFAMTRQWIGDDAFLDAVVHHIQRVPPGSWTLDAYPRDFPATLALRYPDDPEVIELAELELALAEAFVGPDAETITAEQLAHIDWDEAVFRFSPTLDVLRSTTNAPAIWSALAEEAMPSPARLLVEPAALLVWRCVEASRFRVLEVDEHQAILLARGGLSFGGLCRRLAREMGDEQGIEFAGRCLGQWLADGLITAIAAEQSGG